MGANNFDSTSEWLGFMDWQLAGESSTTSNECALNSVINYNTPMVAATSSHLDDYLEQEDEINSDLATQGFTQAFSVACQSTPQEAGPIADRIPNSHTSCLMLNRTQNTDSGLMQGSIVNHDNTAPLHNKLNSEKGPRLDVADNIGGQQYLSSNLLRMHSMQSGNESGESGKVTRAASLPSTALQFSPGTISFNTEVGSTQLEYVEDDSFVNLIASHNSRLIKKPKLDDSSARHCLAERKRREKLNKNLEDLRAVVSPLLSMKADKASVIEAAVRLLIETVKPPLVSKQEKNTLVSEREDAARLDEAHKSQEGVLSKVFCDLQDELIGDAPSIEVTIAQKSHYIISIRAHHRPGIILDIILALTKLNLRILYANSCSCITNTSGSTSSFQWFLSKIEVIDATPVNKRADLHKSIEVAIKECVTLKR